MILASHGRAEAHAKGGVTAIDARAAPRLEKENAQFGCQGKASTAHSTARRFRPFI
jgi:hypothetical protein